MSTHLLVDRILLLHSRSRRWSRARSAPVTFASLLVIASGAAPVRAQVSATFLVSKSSAGVQSNYGSVNSALSADGRFVAMQSIADNLVAGDTNNDYDIFVRDRALGLMEMASVSSGGIQGDMASFLPALTPDARYVVFASVSTNLVAGDTNGFVDIFMRDRVAGLTERVSIRSGGTEADGDSIVSAISADGRFVAFDSTATNLVNGDGNALSDIFLRDRASGSTTRVSVSTAGADSDGDSINPVISADGRYVAFESVASNLVLGDTNNLIDVFVRDLQGGTTTRVSVGPGGVQGNDNSTRPSLSASGRYIAFESWATNLVLGDANAFLDIFVRDLQTGATTLVSRDSGGVQGNNLSTGCALSADGTHVVFESWATNLVPGDTNSMIDIFLRDIGAGTTLRASVSSDGVEADGMSGGVLSISSTGRYVSFWSQATNLVLVDDNGVFEDIFVHDSAAVPLVYCTAKTNSLGCVPTIGFSGTPSASSSSGFTVRGSNVRNQKQGLLFYGVTAQTALSFQGGTLCVHAPIRRTTLVSSGGNPLPANNCSGVYSIDMNAFAHGLLGGSPLPVLSLAGTLVQCQWWGRDPGFPAPLNTTLTDAMEYAVGL